MGDNYREVFETWIERAENLTWFLMGRSLLQLVTTGELANKDTDIDIACLRSDALTVKELFADWPIGFELYEKDVTHQLCYYPQSVLVDVHFFGDIPEHFGYKNQFNKWVTRPATDFEPSNMSTQYGTVKLPANPEKFLHDDYGPRWRDKPPVKK